MNTVDESGETQENEEAKQTKKEVRCCCISNIERIVNVIEIESTMC